MIDYLTNLDILHNRILWTAVISNFIAQILKVFTHLITEREFNIRRAIETGGMPSSHSSTVAALATGVGLEAGFGSPVFALAAVFALVVLHDAAGVRKAAGDHAMVLNSIMKELQHLFEEGFQPRQLKTLLGHTRLQVAAGTTMGILIALLIIEVIWVPHG